MRLMRWKAIIIGAVSHEMLNGDKFNGIGDKCHDPSLTHGHAWVICFTWTFALFIMNRVPLYSPRHGSRWHSKKFAYVSHTHSTQVTQCQSMSQLSHYSSKQALESVSDILERIHPFARILVQKTGYTRIQLRKKLRQNYNTHIRPF